MAGQDGMNGGDEGGKMSKTGLGEFVVDEGEPEGRNRGKRLGKMGWRGYRGCK